MNGWDLSQQNLSIFEAGVNENILIWQEKVKWQWRTNSLSDCYRGITGEFIVKIPPGWVPEEKEEQRFFSMTANMYVEPGKKTADDSVKLVAYDPIWEQQFKDFAKWLQDFLKPTLALQIEHIGSTSIPDMIAKPVLDILVKVASLAGAKQIVLPLINNPNWEYFWYHNHITLVKRDKPGGTRTHHVHLMSEGKDFHDRIAFRDYLRAHSDDATNYATLKQSLVNQNNKDRERYTHAKGNFIKGIIEKSNV